VQVLPRQTIAAVRPVRLQAVSTSASAEVKAYTIEEKGSPDSTDYRVFFHANGEQELAGRPYLREGAQGAYAAQQPASPSAAMQG
jgi:hypothetical protein